MLSDIRVLDLTAETCGLAGHVLAQHGADVVLVEPPPASTAVPAPTPPTVPAAGGGEVSAWRIAFGRGKRSVVLDLADEADRARFDELLRGADVLLESWSTARAPGVGAHAPPDRGASTHGWCTPRSPRSASTDPEPTGRPPT